MSDTPPAGWYPDPTARHQNRWFDGSDWTDQVADGQAVASDPVQGAAPAAATAAEAPAVVAPGAGTPPPGAAPLGDYTPPSSGSSGGNRTLWVVLGIAAVVVAVAVGAAVSSSGGSDDDPGDAGADGSSSIAQDQSDAPPDDPSASDLFDDMAGSSDSGSGDDPGTGAYPAEVIDNFVAACVGGGATEALCQCTIDVFQRDVPYDRFVEIDQEAGAGADVPVELTDAVAECQ